MLLFHIDANAVLSYRWGKKYQILKTKRKSLNTPSTVIGLYHIPGENETKTKKYLQKF